jgi:hypothetical protein
VIIPDLVALSNKLSTAPEHLASTGDGILIIHCNDFTVQGQQ